MSELSLTKLPEPPVDPVAAPVRASPLTRLRRISIFDALAVLILLTAASWALFPGWFATADPLTGDPSIKLRPPSLEHLFGTDQLGRDMWARTVHGTVLTLQGATIAIVIGFVVGTTLGLLAGALGGWVEAVIMRVVDVLLALPGFLIALTIVAAIGPGVVIIAIAIGITSVATFARLLRAEVLRVRKFDFVEAAALSGFTTPHIIFREILPNSAGPVLALVAIEISHSIVAISGLGFLGYGEPAPTPEWGVLVAEGRNYLASAWWITTLPGVVLVLTVVSLARLSRRLQTWRSI
ncbi:ABC transporter permease [Nocardia sp. NPDC058176]|uniref:ABC transporter permease n=1 Tax=Nocardia sp. NPDC058176 TaxID=3346368 RepID=UPI0036DCEE03